MFLGSEPELMDDSDIQKKILALLIKARKCALYEDNPSNTESFTKSLDKLFNVKKSQPQRRSSGNDSKEQKASLRPKPDVLRVIASVGEPQELPLGKLPTVREVIQHSLAVQQSRPDLTISSQGLSRYVSGHSPILPLSSIPLLFLSGRSCLI